jgi:hypothetical protein
VELGREPWWEEDRAEGWATQSRHRRRKQASPGRVSRGRERGRLRSGLGAFAALQ